MTGPSGVGHVVLCIEWPIINIMILAPVCCQALAAGCYKLALEVDMALLLRTRFYFPPLAFITCTPFPALPLGSPTVWQHSPPIPQAPARLRSALVVLHIRREA